MEKLFTKNRWAVQDPRMVRWVGEDLGSVMEVHPMYLKSLKVTLKTGPNPNPLFIYF